MKALLSIIILIVLTLNCHALNPADLNGTWEITVNGGIKVFSQWVKQPSHIKQVSITQTCELSQYYEDEAFSVYDLWCENEDGSIGQGWFQYGSDGKITSGELYMVHWGMDAEDTYTVADCLINRVSTKGMRGQSKVHDNDRVFQGWGSGSCSMKKK